MPIAGGQWRLVLWGVIGGLVGAVIMDAVLVLSKVGLGMPADADFVVMGTALGFEGSAAAGAVAHHLMGMLLGAVFAFITVIAPIRLLTLSSLEAAVTSGVVYGLSVYSILFIPTLVFLFRPVMEDMMGAEAASAIMPIVMGLGATEHVFYGLAVALVLYAAKARAVKPGEAAGGGQQLTL